MANDRTPPDGESRPPRGEPANVEAVTTPLTYDRKRSAAPRHCAADVRPSWRRRRDAAYRCEPLECGHRDPWQPWRPERLSENDVDGVVAAVLHLADAGLLALVDVHTQRALWRAGHHALVDALRGGR